MGQETFLYLPSCLHQDFISFTLALGKAALHSQDGTEGHISYSLCPQGVYGVSQEVFSMES